MHWAKSGKETCVCHLPVCIQHKVFSLCCDFYDPQERRGSRSQEGKKWPANEDKFYVARKLRTLFIARANACPFADEAADLHMPRTQMGLD